MPNPITTMRITARRHHGDNASGVVSVCESIFSELPMSRRIHAATHRHSWSLMNLTVVWRPSSAIARVSGIPFGQTLSQFCALPQSVTPPTPISASKRSSLFSAAVGCSVNSVACPMAAGPMNREWSLTCGHASRQQPHVMQVERMYANSCVCIDTRGPGTKVVGSIDRDPRFDVLEVREHPAPIDDEITHDGELGHRLKDNRLLELIDQCGAGLAHPAVDEH